MKIERTALVTGANSGIGLETVIGLAKEGIHVFLACRNVEKANDAVLAVKRRLPDAQLSVLKLDLADPLSVQKCAADFQSKASRLDILVNNAGIMVYSRRINDDGVEAQFRTNHLSHFQLTALLFSMIPDVPASRVVSLSSIAHKPGKIRFDDLSCDNTLDVSAAYAQSKLACLMFAIELDRRLRAAGRKTLSVAAHPGVSQTQLFTDTPAYLKASLMFMGPFLTHAPKHAAKPSLHAALGQEVEGGDYFGPQGLMEMSGKVGHSRKSSRSQDAELGKQLWEVSEEMTHTQFTI